MPSLDYREPTSRPIHFLNSFSVVFYFGVIRVLELAQFKFIILTQKVNYIYSWSPLAFATLLILSITSIIKAECDSNKAIHMCEICSFSVYKC